jgi:hypothetical protein
MLHKVELFQIELPGGLWTTLDGVCIQIAAFNASGNTAVCGDVVSKFNHLDSVLKELSL